MLPIWISAAKNDDSSWPSLLSCNMQRLQDAAIRKARCRRLAHWKLEKVTEFMLANLSERQQLSTLATISGLSKSHFARAFKGSTGLPPHCWLLTMRIKRACAMLTETDMPIIDIAYLTGFADQSHFTRRFRQVVGMSPGALRRTQKERA